MPPSSDLRRYNDPGPDNVECGQQCLRVPDSRSRRPSLVAFADDTRLERNRRVLRMSASSDYPRPHLTGCSHLRLRQQVLLVPETGCRPRSRPSSYRLGRHSKGLPMPRQACLADQRRVFSVEPDSGRLRMPCCNRSNPGVLGPQSRWIVLLVSCVIINRLNHTSNVGHGSSIKRVLVSPGNLDLLGLLQHPSPDPAELGQDILRMPSSSFSSIGLPSHAHLERYRRLL